MILCLGESAASLGAQWPSDAYAAAEMTSASRRSTLRDVICTLMTPAWRRRLCLRAA